jgi:subtilisin family serine protease
MQLSQQMPPLRDRASGLVRRGWRAAWLLLLPILLGAAPAEPVAVVRESMQVPWRAGQAFRLTPQARRLILSQSGQLTSMPGNRLSSTGLPPRLLVRSDGGAVRLQQLGVSAQPLSPTVSSVEASVLSTTQLLSLPGIWQIDGEHQLRPLLDQSRAMVGARYLGDELSLRGRGVMVAIVDTGIDFRHQDFRLADGTTRISYLMDAGLPRLGSHPEIPDYDGMSVFTAADINALLTAEQQNKPPPVRIGQQDLSGHGTHVAGIAAGSGRATGRGQPAGRYVGMAPEASLCVVKGTRNDETFSDIDILTGVRFCLERAQADGLPVVVNLSLGSGGGPHDGGSALELALDELIGDRPGRALVAAAGNSGEDDIHASSSLLDGTHEIAVRVKSLSDKPQTQSAVAIEIFYDTAAPHKSDGAGVVDIEVRAPGGKVLKGTLGESVRGRFDEDGEAIIDNSDTAMTGLRGAVVLLAKDAGKGSLADGDWVIRLRGQTLRYDLWLVQSSDDLDAQLRGHLDPDGYLEIPATARTALSVGSLRTRMAWPRLDGRTTRIDRETGWTSPFSAGGATRDGRFAPDVLAPGEWIISSMSKSAPPQEPLSSFRNLDDPGLFVADDGVHGLMRGTSQAAPHVTGAVALLLQLNPDLRPSELRELLRTTTQGLLAGGFGPRQGFGPLSLRTTLQRLRGEPALAVSAATSQVGVSSDIAAPGFGLVTVTVTAKDSQGVVLWPGHRVDIQTSVGEWDGPVRDLGSGRYERTLRTRGQRGAQATLTVHVDGVELLSHPTVFFVHERDEIGRPYEIGACGLSGSRSASSRSGLWLLGLLLLSLLRPWRVAVRGPFLVLLALLPAWGCSDGSPDGAVPAASESSSSTAPAGVRAIASKRGGIRTGIDYFWNASESLQSPSIQIHLAEQRADIFDAGGLVAQSSVCTGRKSRKTPAGSYTVLEKIPEHVSSRYGDFVNAQGQVVLSNIDLQNTIPPEGAVFKGTAMPYFLRIFGGIGMHAGPLPGYPDSHGCIRFPPSIAARMFAAVPLGTPVQVLE